MERARPRVPAVLVASAMALGPGTGPTWLVPAGDAERSLGEYGLHPDWLAEAQDTEMQERRPLCLIWGWAGWRMPSVALERAVTCSGEEKGPGG